MRTRSASGTWRLDERVAEVLGESQQRQAWQQATTTITMLLLSGADPQEVRGVVTGHAMRLGHAAGAAIVVPADDPGVLRVAEGAGLLDPGSVGQFTVFGDALLRLAATGGSATVVEDLVTEPPSPGLAEPAPGVGPAVAAALGADLPDGTLLVIRGRHHPPFRAPDVEMIASFASQVGVALALADARRTRDLLRLVEDRERIAAQLGDQAMRTLLKISTTMHGLVARMQFPDDAQRLSDQVDRLDSALCQMQRAIFELPVQPGTWQGSAAC